MHKDIRSRIHAVIETKVLVVDGANVYSDRGNSKHGLPISHTDVLPVRGVHTVEGNLTSGDDEIEVEYFLQEYVPPSRSQDMIGVAFYTFRRITS